MRGEKIEIRAVYTIYGGRGPTGRAAAKENSDVKGPEIVNELGSEVSSKVTTRAEDKPVLERTSAVENETLLQTFEQKLSTNPHTLSQNLILRESCSVDTSINSALRTDVVVKLPIN